MVLWTSARVQYRQDERHGHDEQPDGEGVGPGIADDPHERLRHVFGRAADLHRLGDRDHGPDEHHRRPGDAAVGLVEREDAQQHQRASCEQPSGDRGHETGRQQDDPRHLGAQRPVWTPRPTAVAVAGTEVLTVTSARLAALIEGTGASTLLATSVILVGSRAARSPGAGRRRSGPRRCRH
jgi:hypothetical protein